MNRKFKNIFTIIILIAMICIMIFTINTEKDNNISNMSNNDLMTIMQENVSSDNNSNMNEPPEKPDGENDSNMSEPPEKPDGDNNSMPIEMPNNMNMDNNSSTNIYLIISIEAVIISSILVYLLMSKFNKKTFKETFKNSDKIIIYSLFVIIITISIIYLDSKLMDKKDNNNFNNHQMSNNSNITYSATKEITSDSDIESGTYESTKEDNNVILVSNSKSNISNVTINKTGDSEGGDNTSFYGNNSAIIAKDGATLSIKNSIINTDATGSNGVFSYGGTASTSTSTGDGTTVNISDSKITTTKDNSGGIMTTGGGNMNATNLTINTSGVSSAAIRTDRGGGVVTVTKGTYKTTGAGSPSVYSTADITVNDANLISESSEGIIIEGKNKVSLNNVILTDNNTKLNGKSTTYKNIFLYQSMSGDADNGIAEFISKDSKITTNNGDTFYITNTSASITLENNTIVNNDSNGNFLRAQKDSWGNTNSNGGNVTLKMTNQTVNGNIVIDSISTLDMTLNDSKYEGTINNKNEAKSIKLKLDKNSKIKLTGDSYVTSLENEDESNNNIDFNGYNLYVNGVKVSS